jgi:hypothetical protein
MPTTPHSWWVRSLVALAVVALNVMVWTEVADARRGGGSSPGGAGAFISLPGNAVIALDRPMVANGAPQPSHPGGSLGGLYNRPGLLGGFSAGFLGSGFFGLFFGRGMLGELGSIASYLGLALQLGLIAMLGGIIWAWWRGGHVAALAEMSPRQLADAYSHPRDEMHSSVDSAASVDRAISKRDQD